MGTNFYWHDRPCDHCGRLDIVHVGKRSAGWSFGFRAWPDALLSPLDSAIQSRTDWVKAITDRPGFLVDEYGVRIGDPAGWLADLIPPTDERRAWEDSNMGSFRWLGDHHWRDAEGFRFTDREFS